jgi:transposase
MIKLEEFMDIFRLREMGYSISGISRETGKDRKTVRKYLNQGKSKIPAMKKHLPKDSKLEPFKEYIDSLLKGSETEFPPFTVIYEQIVKRGYNGSLSLVQKWFKIYREERFPKVVIRYETPAGQQAQVDWGEKKIKDKTTGIVRKVYIFCMTLSFSRTRFTHFTPRADMYNFLLCHKLAFEYFGGVPREILYDQNRCVVIKPGLKDIKLNRRFLDFALHYDFRPRLCRIYRPQTKGKVENTVKFVKQNFLSIQDTNDIKVLNRRKKDWLFKVNSRVHSTTKEIPFKRLAKENLSDIKTFSAYDLYYMETRKVFNDSTFSFYSQRYSVPPIYIGKTMTVKYRPNVSRIDVYFKEKFITQHRTDSPDQYVIKRSHRHSIWQIWRNDKKLYYKKSKETKTANHPLIVYEQIGLMEQLYAQSSNAQ